MYVNDAIGFKLRPEQILYYSPNCFGTADAIDLRGDLLRIHDLKTGKVPAHIEQLMIYAALFCLEYGIKPSDIDTELRIYQGDDILVENYDNTGRQIPGKRTDIDKASFRDAKLTFTEEQVKKETARCLGCGATIVDPNQCVGCGVCTTKCEFDAIHLHRDIPEASIMRKSEDKLKYILPYGAKQAIKIKFSGKKKKS